MKGPCQRSWELEQRVVDLMRGLLNAMMRQAGKVERFKRSLDPLDALHAKYDSASEPVVPDDGWGHLQIDATSLFLLQLAQLTRSGLTLIHNRHEAAFVQNLVYYVSRAYRVPDYGIWERGDKGNHGLPERNASSIGMAKAALEALDGIDLYGEHGDGSTQVLIPMAPSCVCDGPPGPAAKGIRQQGSRQRLPLGDRLSGLAVEDPGLIERTSARIRRELGGAYGYKRFRRDGHQTVVEDISRLHYERDELAKFEGIESEWPLFLAYELMTACCEQRWDDARQWQAAPGGAPGGPRWAAPLPELYLVPEELLALERRNPGSQRRVANENVPLLWTQSLAWLGEMLLEGLIEAGS